MPRAKYISKEDHIKILYLKVKEKHSKEISKILKRYLRNIDRILQKCDKRSNKRRSGRQKKKKTSPWDDRIILRLESWENMQF